MWRREVTDWFVLELSGSDRLYHHRTTLLVSIKRQYGHWVSLLGDGGFLCAASVRALRR